jgi:hypothetical protein
VGGDGLLELDVRRHGGASERGDGVARIEPGVRGRAALDDPGQRGARTRQGDAEERVVPQGDRGRLLAGDHPRGDPEDALAPG